MQRLKTINGKKKNDATFEDDKTEKYEVYLPCNLKYDSAFVSSFVPSLQKKRFTYKYDVRWLVSPIC